MPDGGVLHWTSKMHTYMFLWSFPTGSGSVFASGTYRYKLLPFGLSIAPRTSTWAVKVMVEYLRQRGIFVCAFLDDWLIIDYSTIASYPLSAGRARQPPGHLIPSDWSSTQRNPPCCHPNRFSFWEPNFFSQRERWSQQRRKWQYHRMCRRIVASRD